MRLEEWLDTATYGLMPEARERIRHEVHGHIAAAMASGADEADVVEQLGSPRKARRRYGRRYMTAEQVRSIELKLQRSWPDSIEIRWRTLRSTILVIFTFYLVLNSSMETWVDSSMLGIALLNFGMWLREIGEIALGRQRIVLSALLEILGTGNTAAGCACMVVYQLPDTHLVVSLIIGVLLCIELPKYMRTMRLIAKNPELLTRLCLQPKLDSRRFLSHD